VLVLLRDGLDAGDRRMLGGTGRLDGDEARELGVEVGNAGCRSGVRREFRSDLEELELIADAPVLDRRGGGGAGGCLEPGV
jgi:hypothetical protein